MIEDRLDRLDPNAAVGAAGLLGAFNQAGVVVAADVHVARCLARLGHDPDERVMLAAALAVRAPRYGHVYVDLATIRHTATDADETTDPDTLPWPAEADWLDTVAVSPLVATGEDGPPERPLRLIGSALYLDRYWRDERAVAADLLLRASGAAVPVDDAVLARMLGQLFPGPQAMEQRWAAAAAVTRRFSVVAGGPGTGKTTTVARYIALLYELAEAAAARPPLVALAAPTGKAAARMEEAVRSEAAQLPVSSTVRRNLEATSASTLHRLLGRRPDSNSRFRHDRHHRLPHDILVVDETSMVPLSLMARVAEAVRPDARLVLVGDPQQLASVEAGAVLGDIVGPALTRMRISAGAAERLGRLCGGPLPLVDAGGAGGPLTDGALAGGALAGAPAADSALAGGPPGPPPGLESPVVGIGDGVIVLRANHRFGGALATLAGAIRSGEVDEVMAVLAAGDPAVGWLAVDESAADPAADDVALAPIRGRVAASAASVFDAASAGDAAGALDALDQFRVLCAHRRGPAGVSTWTPRIEGWLTASIERFAPVSPWYLGRPVMVTANDYALRLFNGDTGVVVARPDEGVAVAVRRADGAALVSPARLAGVDTVFAMTVHKAQGSEFDEVVVVLPDSDSPLLTRELLYTAVTRARRRLDLVGSEASVRAAVARPIARASGLTARLWP